MKKLVQEIENEGLPKLLGETVTLFCLNYFYNGKLVGVNDDCVLLQDPKIIYETGEWSNSKWKDIQDMGMPDIYQFTVPVDDIGNATLLAQDKAITYMRWIRKAISDNTLIKIR